MPERPLAQVLEELRAHLEHPDALDDEARRALADCAGEIRRALGESMELRDQITAGIDRFEESHPKLVESLRRVVDQLAEMGI